MPQPTIILHYTYADEPYLGAMKALLAGRCKCYIDNTDPVAATEFCMKSKAKGNAVVVTTSEKLLKFLKPEEANPRISEFAGSFFQFKDTWFLILDPLEQLFTVPSGRFVTRRFLDKILAPHKFLAIPPFKWELFEPSKVEELLEFFDSCNLIAIDTETFRGHPERIFTCVGYSGIILSGGRITIRTVVVPCDDHFNILFIRAMNDTLPAKTFQNGKYDLAYFFRYSAPVFNYSFDTINLFHSWFSELPKDLGFISAFMLREYSFHKNKGQGGDKYAYYAYNAEDCYTTVLTTVALLLELPDYAMNNFLMEFPTTFPCHLAEMTGIKWDEKHAAVLKKQAEEKVEGEKAQLQKMVCCPTYNPNSSQQTVRLFAILGSKDITDSTPPSKDKVASRHPINKRIIDSIIAVRELNKLVSNYFKDSIPWLGRCFYALNPFGTDTGRLASKESQYWCGLQIQNIPRDPDDDDDVTVKEAFVVDDDFLFGEGDFSQAETWGTAYLSGDKNLIKAIEDPSKDFHSYNASALFGKKYEEICKSVFDEALQLWKHERLSKAIINVAKRTNHGANYNMGAQVLLDTMGIAKVIAAKQLLGFPKHWAPIQVCQKLLDIFDSTYPILRDTEHGWYAKVINDVITTHLLIGPTGWTRYCFGEPKKNKRHLNSYVAHPPQSLNAMILNKAWMRVFQEVWIPNPMNFKLHAQIHDSIFFAYRKKHEHLAWKVKECMRIPVMVKDIFGTTRELIVPVDLKIGGTRWSNVKKVFKQPEIMS